MREFLPGCYREDPWITAITGAMEGALTRQDAQAGEITSQMSLDTVTWNLPVEERVAGLVPGTTATVEERRTALKARWRSGGKVTIDQLQAVADAWKNGVVTVTFKVGRVGLAFTGAFGVPEDMDSLKAAMRVVVPAHLPIDYQLRYILIRDLKSMTVGELQTHRINEFAFTSRGDNP